MTLWKFIYATLNGPFCGIHATIKSAQWIYQTLDTNPCDKMLCQIACY